MSELRILLGFILHNFRTELNLRTEVQVVCEFWLNVVRMPAAHPLHGL